jgi:hypothetical protein
MDVLFLMLIVSTGTILGNEFCIGFLIHPALSRTDAERFLPAIQVIGRLLGQVMPFWMGGTALFQLVLLVVTWHWPATSTGALLVATLLWSIVIIFSLVAEVPINNRVIAWDLQKLPADWRAQRNRWDQLHVIRVVLIAVALVALVVSYRTLG